MPSEFQKILMSLQKDLNAITISAAAANHALSGMLDMYNESVSEFSPDRRNQCVGAWTRALNVLTESLEAFGTDGVKLQEYIDGQR